MVKRALNCSKTCNISKLKLFVLEFKFICIELSSESQMNSLFITVSFIYAHFVQRLY